MSLELMRTLEDKDDAVLLTDLCRLILLDFGVLDDVDEEDALLLPLFLADAGADDADDEPTAANDDELVGTPEPPTSPPPPDAPKLPVNIRSNASSTLYPLLFNVSDN